MAGHGVRISLIHLRYILIHLHCKYKSCVRKDKSTERERERERATERERERQRERERERERQRERGGRFYTYFSI